MIFLFIIMQNLSNTILKSGEEKIESCEIKIDN